MPLEQYALLKGTFAFTVAKQIYPVNKFTAGLVPPVEFGD